MRFALDSNNKRIEVSTSREKASCPDCNEIVIGKKGRIKQKHWSHKSKNCDSWYEPMSDWHLNWQNIFPEQNREVSMRDEETGIMHRADVRLNNGLVIEFQNSALKIDEVEQRERFYGKKNMIWVCNGTNLLSKSNIEYQFNRKEFRILFLIASYLQENPQYDMDDFQHAIFEHEYFNALFFREDVKFKTKGGYKFKLEFNSNNRIRTIVDEIEVHITEIYEKLYGNQIGLSFKDEFQIYHTICDKDTYFNITLTPKYWSKFIDKMNHPVFIDGLPGLEPHLLYWHNMKKIVTKENFIKKYLKYC